MSCFYSFWSHFNSKSGVKIFRYKITPFWGYFNSSISEMIFTPEKEFFKLLFGVKVNPPENNATARS